MKTFLIQYLKIIFIFLSSLIVIFANGEPNSNLTRSSNLNPNPNLNQKKNQNQNHNRNQYPNPTASLIPNLDSVDLRDLLQFQNQELQIVNAVLKDIKSNPCRYVFMGPSSDAIDNEQNYKSDEINDRINSNTIGCNTDIKLTETGAMGPNGEDHKNIFVVDSQSNNLNTRINTILSVHFDGSDWKTTHILNQKLSVKIVLFINDQKQYQDSNHFYFRKLELLLDKGSNLNGAFMTTVMSAKDIPLKETSFSFYTDITERKTVLVDAKNKIRKVFPVAVGALDVRTFDGMDNFVGSMTLELKSNARISKSQSLGLFQSRTSPWFYKGRPFLGVMDDEGQSYKEIGYHYKIDDGPLVRGFITHGCLRVRDMDLYQMEAIVFHGSQAFVPVKIINSFAQDLNLKKFQALDHPYPKKDVGFYFLAYANNSYLSDEMINKVDKNIGHYPNSSRMSEVEQYLWCRQNGMAQPLRHFGNWSSALDHFCLTKIASSNQNIQPFIDYILGDKDAEAYIEPLEPAEPMLIQGLCAKGVSLSQASQIYETKKSKTLTFGIYVDHCGCTRFKKELGQKIFKDLKGEVIKSKQVHELYCGHQD